MFWKKRKQELPITIVVKVNKDGSFAQSFATDDDARRWCKAYGVTFIDLLFKTFNDIFARFGKAANDAGIVVDKYNQTIIRAPRIEGDGKYNSVKSIRVGSATLHPVVDDFSPDIMG